MLKLEHIHAFKSREGEIVYNMKILICMGEILYCVVLGIWGVLGESLHFGRAKE